MTQEILQKAIELDEEITSIEATLKSLSDYDGKTKIQIIFERMGLNFYIPIPKYCHEKMLAVAKEELEKRLERQRGEFSRLGKNKGVDNGKI